MYKVTVDFCPAYELVTSLTVYLEHKQYKFLELPSDWLRQVRSQISPSLAERLAQVKSPPVWSHLALLVSRCPDRENFVNWYGSRSPGELYEHLTPPARHLPADLGAQRDSDVELLTGWQEEYFRHLDPAILSGLTESARQTESLIGTLSPPDLVERSTMGMWVEPEESIEQVLLVPQHHFRPWTVPAHLQGLRIYGYPADVLPAAPDEPSPGLLRLTRALGDESRLKILRFLAGGNRTFTDVLHFSGLSKGTVNHHLVALRAAGLVRIHDGPTLSRVYSLRPGALRGVGARLAEFANDPT